MQLKHFFSDARSCLQSFRTAAFSWRTLISAAGILIIMVLFALVITPVRYNISVGMVPTHTITANRDDIHLQHGIPQSHVTCFIIRCRLT